MAEERTTKLKQEKEKEGMDVLMFNWVLEI